MDDAPVHKGETTGYDRLVKSPMSAQALRSLKKAFAENRVPRRTVARRPAL